MTLAPGLVNLHDGTAPATHAAASLAVGVIALLTVATVIVAATYRLRRRAAQATSHLPPRGTSALLLGVIGAVLLVLVATSEQRIPSLTIVSHAGAAGAHPPARRLGRACPATVSAFERPAPGVFPGRFAVKTGGALKRRRCPVTVPTVVRASRLLSP